VGFTIHQGYIDVGLIFEKDSMSKQECVRYVDSDYAGDLDKRRSTKRYVFKLSQAPVNWRSIYSLSLHYLLQRPTTWS